MIKNLQHLDPNSSILGTLTEGFLDGNILNAPIVGIGDLSRLQGKLLLRRLLQHQLGADGGSLLILRGAIPDNTGSARGDMIPHPAGVGHRQPNASVGIHLPKTLKDEVLVGGGVLLGIEDGMEIDGFADLGPILAIASIPGKLAEAYRYAPISKVPFGVQSLAPLEQSI